MSVQGWKYYNHAMIPDGRPDQEPDLTPVENGEIWSNVHGGGTPLLARWTTDWDCGYETNWWYLIKDGSFDIEHLKSGYRYKINKGIKHFDVRLIHPCDYKEELYIVQVAAFSAYPEKYRPKVDKESFIRSIDYWGTYDVFGAFSRENGELVGYTLISKVSTEFYDLSVQKTNPQYERLQLNAALVEGVLHYYAEFLSCGGIICDGSRSINHETNFQDYLEKYFGFRKAYCKLHILYNPKIAWLIKVLYPFRKVLLKFDGNGLAHQVNAVLKMEEIVRG